MKWAYAAFVLVLAANGHAQATDEDNICPDDLGGQTMLLSGSVVEVGHDGFSQYMVVHDDDTGCRVVVFVDEGEMPCNYKQHARIALKVRKADNAEVSYFDGGGTEPYFCSEIPSE